MKVSSKIIAGFLILMLLGLVVLANQLSVIHQMQSINRDLSEINMSAATTVLAMRELTDILNDDSKKYLAGGDPIYERLIDSFRKEFLDDLAQLQRTVRSDRERQETARLAAAFEDYSRIFNGLKQRLKEQNQTWDPDDLPPDLTIAVDHLQAQTGIVYEAVKGSMKDQVATAVAVGQKAERISWLAGVFALVLGTIVAALIVRSINDPLRRLTHGTRAIAKGQFWHRLPAHGKDEFAELARDFNVMSEKLGELDQMKKDFVSHVSHDLKAPLASIRQIMHLLLQEIPGPLNEQQQDLIRLSYNSAERLAAMVGNLLDVSRMEAGTMEYQMSANDAVAIIKSVSDEFEVQAREKGIRLRLECEQPSVFVDCDRERIVQVVGNLFENALKFSPGNSEIVTRVGQGKGGEILISVSDSGPGVPDAHKEKIFHKFHQVKHGRKMAGQGVGLGLAICKTIVEAHHGQIWVQDNPKGGSVFSFVLQPAASEEILKCGQTA
jgi:two-component system sensor histidine kinase GlrK